jgi:hypothetical protein
MVPPASASQGKPSKLIPINGSVATPAHMQTVQIAAATPTQPTTAPAGEALVMRIAPHVGQEMVLSATSEWQMAHCMMVFP